MYSIEEFDKEKTKVMKFLTYKKRTELEVKNKFKNIIQNELLCDIISYVKEAGYLNDKDYVKRAVKEYMCLKNMSAQEIKYKLLNKGISKDDIEDYFYNHKEEIEEYEKKSAEIITLKKQSILEKEEIQMYLLKKGYKEQIIKEVLECKTY